MNIRSVIGNENKCRRNLFYSFLDGNTSINNDIYTDLLKVSPEFSNSYLKSINKRELVLRKKTIIIYLVGFKYVAVTIF